MLIALTANNRAKYLEQTLESWREVDWIEYALIRFHVEPGNQSVLELCESVDFCSTEITLNEERLGVLHNPWVALDTSFKKAPFVILAEDDVIVAPDILRYFSAMDRHKYDSRVLAVCAFQGSPVHGAPHLTWKEHHFAPLIWGTWKGRWKNRLRDTWDHDYSSGRGDHSGWDWNIRLRVMREDDSCIFPDVSRSQHIGQYGGAHMMPEDFAASQAPMFAGNYAYRGEYE